MRVSEWTENMLEGINYDKTEHMMLPAKTHDVSTLLCSSTSKFKIKFILPTLLSQIS